MAVTDSAFGVTSTTPLPAAASCWHWRSAAGMTRKPRHNGASTTTRSKPAARSALAAERIPPSIHRRPLISTGGQTPGTAQLALTATIRSAAVRSSPRAASPATRPTSQAAPVMPPLPSTSALLATPAPLPPHATGDGNLPGVTVEVVHQVTDELVEAFARLVPQLSAS